MIQVKEFLNCLGGVEENVNTWIKENSHVQIVDIKYSVNLSEQNEVCEIDVYSNALILYLIL